MMELQDEINLGEEKIGKLKNNDRFPILLLGAAIWKDSDVPT